MRVVSTRRWLAIEKLRHRPKPAVATRTRTAHTQTHLHTHQLQAAPAGPVQPRAAHHAVRIPKQEQPRTKGNNKTYPPSDGTPTRRPRRPRWPPPRPPPARWGGRARATATAAGRCPTGPRASWRGCADPRGGRASGRNQQETARHRLRRAQRVARGGDGQVEKNSEARTGDDEQRARTGRLGRPAAPRCRLVLAGDGVEKSGHATWK